MPVASLLARHARLVLVAGLVIGILAPGLAELLRPAVGPTVILLLFIAVLRMGPQGVSAGLRGLPGAIGRTLVFQLALPVAVAALFAAAGALAHPIAMGCVLALAAPPITGSANITLMVGGEPGAALRQLVVGTVLLPLTIVPVFLIVPAFGSPQAVMRSAVELLALIALAGAAALALRHFRLVRGTPGALLVMDAAAAFLLGAVVVGLMSAIGPAVLDRLSIFAATLGAAFIVGFAPQLVASLLASRSDPGAATAIGITAGNRNMALFLSVLPAATVDDVLLFVGCFQIPMYLTPFILARWYGRINAAAHRDRGA